MTGGHVDHLSYPAGSVLIQMPALAPRLPPRGRRLAGPVRLDRDRGDHLRLLPTSVRWIAALLLLAPAFTGVFSSGGTDAAFLPFLVLAVWRWDRFGLGRAAGVARWMGPVALGLACSIKQTPWFCVPFIVIGLVIEARRSGRRPVRTVVPYLAIVVGVFAVVNLPFVIWCPAAWARGTFLPFLATSGRRRSGAGHPRSPRDRPRGVDAAAHAGRCSWCWWPRWPPWSSGTRP